MRKTGSVALGCGLFAMVMSASCAKPDPNAELTEKRAKLSEGDTVNVVGVIKGDEVRVQTNGRTARLRLVGIYAMDDAANETDPTTAEGLAASVLKTEVVGRLAVLHLSNPPEDAHGRYLGYLDAGGKDLNLSLLEAGRVVTYTEFPFDRESLYLKAESDARTAKRGLWRRADLVTTVKGLRRQWAEARAQRGAAAADDLLLAAEPADAKAP